jgi:hypothetical protein
VHRCETVLAQSKKRQPREQLRDELTRSVEQDRASYHRLKAAGLQASTTELQEARKIYEAGLERLSQFVQSDRMNTLSSRLWLL